MDKFYEQNVKKITDKEDKRKKVLIIIGALIIAYILMTISLFFVDNLLSPMIICCIAIYMGLRLARDVNYEFEYIFTNGDLDIDMIIAQKKRKRLTSLYIRNITAIGKYTDDIDDNNTNIIKAYEELNENVYYADFNDSRYGGGRLLFTPDEKLLDYITLYLPRDLKRKLEKINDSHRN